MVSKFAPPSKPGPRQLALSLNAAIYMSGRACGATVAPFLMAPDEYLGIMAGAAALGIIVIASAYSRLVPAPWGPPPGPGPPGPGNEARSETDPLNPGGGRPRDQQV